MKKQNAVWKTINHGNRLHFAAVFALAALVALASGAVALYLQYVIDSGIHADQKTMIVMGIAGGCILLLSLCFNTLNVYVGNRYVKNAVLNLKGTLIRKVIGMQLSDYGKRTVGDYISVFNNDLKTIETDFIRSILAVIGNLFSLVIAVVLMFILNYKLTLIVLSLCIIPGIISVCFSGKLQKCQIAVSENNSSYTSFIKEIFSGISVIKSFFLEQKMTNLAQEKANRLEKARMLFSNLVGLITNLCTASSFLIVIAIFVCGIILTQKGELTIGRIMAFVQLLNYVTAPMGVIFENVQKIGASEPIRKKLIDLIDYEASSEKKEEKLTLNDAITFENVSFAYHEGDEPILKNIDLRLEKGKSYALVGMSGSGKSTLMSILAGYYDQYNGSIRVDDTELRTIDEKCAAQLFSFVQQESFVFDDTIDNNIRLYKTWDQERVIRAIQCAGLKNLTDERGIDAPCGENGALLSGGEKQRISIARALLCNAPVLLLDEATSALDAQTTAEVENAIASLENTTRIVITHKMDPDVLKCYDCIILLKNGEIAAQGTYREMLEKSGWFRSLCDAG